MSAPVSSRAAADRQRALARMANISRDVRGSDPVRRVHLIVVIDRLLARLLGTTAWGDWVLKGGFANQLRMPEEARFTEDADVRIAADIGSAFDTIVRAMQHELSDGLSYELARPPAQLSGPPGGGLRFFVQAALQGTALVAFKVDVSSGDPVVGPLERHPSDPIMTRLGYPRSMFPAYPVTQQFAEKIHAYTLPRDTENTRAKDLADLIWLIERFGFDGSRLDAACRATFASRGTHVWPPTLRTPPSSWSGHWQRLLRETPIRTGTPAMAAEVLARFLSEALASGEPRYWAPRRGIWVRRPR